MKQEYKVYVTGVEIGKGVLDRAMKTSKRFAGFVETQMKDSRCERQTLAALLMCPVQHVMRYALLLTGESKDGRDLSAACVLASKWHPFWSIALTDTNWNWLGWWVWWLLENQDVKKVTPEAHPDYVATTELIGKLQEMMSMIDNEKMVVNEHRVLMETLQDIDDLPVCSRASHDRSRCVRES